MPRGSKDARVPVSFLLSSDRERDTAVPIEQGFSPSTGLMKGPTGSSATTAGDFSSPFSSDAAIGLCQQGQLSASSSAQSGGSIGTPSPSGGRGLIVSQAGQPLFNSSLRSLTWLVENLVQMGEVRTSDILPLGAATWQRSP